MLIQKTLKFRYSKIALPIIISVLGHGIFFAIFKISLPVSVASTPQNLYIIPKSQLQSMMEEIDITPLSRSLSSRQSLWADTLLTSIHPSFFSLQKIKEERGKLMLERKRYTAVRLVVPSEIKILPEENIFPEFSHVFYNELPHGTRTAQPEHVFDLGNKMKFSYYIQGPVSERDVEITNPRLEIEQAPIRLKLRFWVTRDGRVDQIILEEGSGFPLTDKNIIRAIKEWYFTPVYILTAPKYQWGIINIKIQETSKSKLQSKS